MKPRMEMLRQGRLDMRGGDLVKRLLGSLPSIVLGVLLNTLDAASTGLLVFPADRGQARVFGDLQAQAMAVYIMSTLVSQLTMTLGGSRFPGALGSMLIEILPFLRGIGADIAAALGDESPRAVVPTVMAAYALTSFLVGACFLVLGLLRLGQVVNYIPTTVLTGTIGAIGLSLFLLGLELTYPPQAPTLTVSTASYLFSRQHIALLLGSVAPAVLLCLSLRSSVLTKITRGLPQHSSFVPTFFLGIFAIFWIVLACLNKADAAGMDSLAQTGWLFDVSSLTTTANTGGGGIGTSWNYWRLFDFSLVRWSALGAATQNIVLLVIIGVVNLPVYIPAMSIALKHPKYDMDWELIGHGASNILSGAVGSVPNMVVLSASRLFTFAGGGRPEALVVTAFTLLLFFVSSRILPYVPTILAANMVLFLGLDLMADALLASTSELLLLEWLVVAGTAACSIAIGFLPGFIIGIGLALVNHFIVVLLSEGRFTSSSCTVPDEKSAGEKVRTVDTVAIVRLTGNLSFAIIPQVLKLIDNAAAQSHVDTVLLDLAKVDTCETPVTSMLRQKATELDTKPTSPSLVLGGFGPGSRLSVDFARGGLTLHWPDDKTGTTGMVIPEEGDVSVPVYLTVHRALLSRAGGVLTLLESVFPADTEAAAVNEIRGHYAAHLADTSGKWAGTIRLSRLLQNGAVVEHVADGMVELPAGDDAVYLVLSGMLCLRTGTVTPESQSPDDHAREQGRMHGWDSKPVAPLIKAMIEALWDRLKKSVSPKWKKGASRDIENPARGERGHSGEGRGRHASTSRDGKVVFSPGDVYVSSRHHGKDDAIDHATAEQGGCWVLAIPVSRMDIIGRLLMTSEVLRRNHV